MGWHTLKKILAHDQPPGYHQSQPRTKRKLEPFLSIIQQILADDRQAPPKQRHTAQRIFERLRRDAHRSARWNMLHPDQPPKQSFVEQTLAGEEGLFVAASDYVRALPEQISRWVPGELCALGTDGLGRSETREALRRHFEVDAESIVIATLYRLHKRGVFEAAFVAQAIKDLGVNPEKIDPYFA